MGTNLLDAEKPEGDSLLLTEGVSQGLRFIKCGTPKIIKPLKTTHRKHALMRKLIDNGTSMFPKWILILEILGVKSCTWTHNTLCLIIPASTL